jgi:DNA methyltransferase 1-associated protein 1
MIRSDVRDILEIDTESGLNNTNKSSTHNAIQQNYNSKRKKVKRLIEPLKRPQGVHREVWGLICKDDNTVIDQPSLIPTEQPKLYKHPKAKLRYGVRKWHWVAFENPARTDSAKFSHWRCVNDDPHKEYPFAKYNKQIQLHKYTDVEYNQHLADDNWSKEDTDYLFELCKRFDLRFFVIHDRWDNGSHKKRSLDELKDRYYKVNGIMQKLRGQMDESQIYVFDFEHEQKRRQQLEKLFNRSKEQIDEELYLIEELKKIEFRKKERERRQQDVGKLLTAVGDLENKNKPQSSPTSHANNSNKKLKQQLTNQFPINSNQRRISDSAPQISQNKHNKQSSQNSLNNSTDSAVGLVSPSNANESKSASTLSANANNPKKSLIFKAVVESAGIKFPDNKIAGVSLRSYKVNFLSFVVLSLVVRYK